MVVWATDKLNTAAGAYDLLARAVRAEWDMDALPELDQTGDGKPFFSKFPQHQFNLSHSGDHALCALDGRPVGADIQIIKDGWRAGLPGRVCSPGELVWLEGQPERWRAFALLWALKEARVKYAGTGLRVGIREISVPLPAPGQGLYLHDGLWFRIYAGGDWMAAVCGETPPPERIIWK